MAFFMNRRKQRALDDIQREIDHLRGRIDHIRGRTEAATGQAVATLKAETGQMARALDHGREWVTRSAWTAGRGALAYGRRHPLAATGLAVGAAGAVALACLLQARVQRR